MRSLHARESWSTIRPLIIESDEEHPSYSQECRWVLFFRYSVFISRSWRSLRSCPPSCLYFPLCGNESWSDPTRVRFNPALLLSSSILPLPQLLRQALAWFITALPAASYKCSGTTLLLRPSFIAAERRRFLGVPLTFPRVLERTSGRNLEDSPPLCDDIKRSIHLRITSNGIYLFTDYNL